MRSDKQSQRRLEDAANAGLLRSVFDEFPALVALLTPDSKVQLVNRRFKEFFGASFEDMDIRVFSAVVHPEDRCAWLGAWKAALESGQPYEQDSRHRRADGRHRYLHACVSSLRDSDGRIALWYVVLSDVDDRKRAEALLAGEKQLLELVASGSPVRVVLEKLCRFFDAAVEGFASSVLFYDRKRERVLHAIGPGLPAGYRQFLESRMPFCPEGPCAIAARDEAQVIVSDLTSDPRWAESVWPAIASAHGLRSCWSTPILSLTGELLATSAFYGREPGAPSPFHQTLIQQFNQIAGIAIERTRSDEALQRSETFLKEAQRMSSTGSFSWRVASDEVTCSEEVYRMYGLDPARPMTLPGILSRTHPEDVHRSREVIEQARAGVEDFDFERRLLMPDQSVKYLHVLAHCTRNLDGDLELFGTLHDITQRRLAEQALDKLRSELAHVARVTTLGTLTASIAHEVNQPLAGIINNASACLRMLADEPPNVEGARETARRTIRDGNRASAVITRLRALFRKGSLTAEPVDLNEAIREVIALSLHQLQRGRVTVREELAHDLPVVIGDRVQLQQVVLNLVLNAAEAMAGVDDRPRLLVIATARDEGDRVRVSTRDAGVGFDPSDADRLFEPFHTTKPGGMGIGLAVSRSIIESHGGRLWAAGNDGPGATFSFSLPIRIE